MPDVAIFLCAYYKGLCCSTPISTVFSTKVDSIQLALQPYFVSACYCCRKLWNDVFIYFLLF